MAKAKPKKLYPSDVADMAPAAGQQPIAPPLPPPQLPEAPVDEEPDDDGGEADTLHVPDVIHSESDIIKASQMAMYLVSFAKKKAESINLYEPLPEQSDFHACTAKQRLIRGSNRAGKSIAAAMECARAVTGKDPYNKYPKTNGIAFIVGKDGKEVGRVLYRYLFRAGSFKIIRDEETKLWRTYRPWQDMHRLSELRLSPPLIPPRFIDSIAWENKKGNVPSLVTLRNGWEMHFFSSLGKPPTGSAIDFCWFDEEVVDPEWMPECMARLVDRGGKFVWSATPQIGTEHLYELHEKAEKGSETVKEFRLLLDDNPYISSADKKEFKDTLSEDAIRVRYYGEYARAGLRVYPEFSEYQHGVPWFDIPKSWTRCMVVDPGRQVCAVLFAAVPPEEEKGNKVYVYDELYIEDCSADIFGERVAAAIGSDVMYAFLIDSRAGRVDEMGSGKNIEQQYSDALRKRRVSSVKTGSGFYWASDDVTGGIEAVRAWLRMREDGPKLCYFRDKCPKLEWEIKRYQYKQDKDGVTEHPRQKNCHMMDNLRYLAMYDPQHVTMPISKPEKSAVIKILEDRARKRKQQDGKLKINLGPGK